jgi:hypothetical protein
MSAIFMIFNFFNGGWNILPAIFASILNLLLLVEQRKKYYPLFQ